MWILFLVVAGLVVFLFLRVPKEKNIEGAQKAPRDVLKRKYTRGEVPHGKIKEVKRDLKK